jgi:hypothetical protein
MNPSSPLDGYRQRPDCGHEFLRECPLTARDWEEVFNAYCAFRLICRAVSERAHEQAEKKQATKVKPTRTHRTTARRT